MQEIHKLINVLLYNVLVNLIFKYKYYLKNMYPFFIII